jgi:L-fuconolactonase
MKIDAHHHLFDFSKDPYDWIVGDAMAPIKRDFTMADLRDAIRNTGISHTILVHATGTHQETHDMLDLAATDEMVLAVVGWLDVQSADSISACDQYLAHPAARYLKGIRDIAQDNPNPDYLGTPQAIKIVKAIGERGLVYEILTKTPELKAAVELVRACPNMQFVLDHISKPYISKQEFEPWKSLISELAQFPNVACKISGLVTEATWKDWKVSDFIPYTDHIIESFSPARIMYGSDWPVALLGAQSYSEVFHLADQLTASLSASEKEALWHLNAARIYKITNL